MDMLWFLARFSHVPALLFLKRGTNRAVICCWFDRTVQEAFLEFHFSTDDLAVPNTLIRKEKIDKMPKTILRSWARVFYFSDRELEKFILEMWVDSPIKTSSLYFLWSWAWDTYFSKSEVDSPIKTSSLYFLWSWAWNIYSFTVRTWAWAYLFLV